MRLLRSLPALFALSILAACDLSTAPDVPDPIDPAKDSYATSLGVDISTMTKLSNGVYIKDKVVGEGAIAATNDSVQINYTGWTPNGFQFDSSKLPSRKPLEFVIGKGVYIPAFESAVIGMQPGGTRQIIIPTALAYGPIQQPGIPPNTNLVFEIEYLARLSGAN
jgi:peptidylprolyl isomerase